MAVKVTEHKPLPRQFPCILKWVPNPEEEVESLPTIVFSTNMLGRSGESIYVQHARIKVTNGLIPITLNGFLPL